MREFKKINKTFIKSKNTTNKIFNRYLYCLIPYFLLIIILSLIDKTLNNIISLLISSIISMIVCLLTQIIFNKIKRESINLKEIFIDGQILTISLMIGLFAINSNIVVMIISSIITIIIKNIFPSKTYSSTLYGLLIILVGKQFLNNLDTPLNNLITYKYIGSYNEIVIPYGSIVRYILGTSSYYLSPILSIGTFIYLFYKKSIKYNIVVSYVLTISFVMLVFGMFNDMNLWYLLFQLTTGNLLFLSVFCLTDYPDTPISGEGQLIYGMILGLITSILRFIIPELAVIIPLILGPILLTRIINKMSFKLKYNRKYYYSIIISIVICIIVSTTILTIMV